MEFTSNLARADRDALLKKGQKTSTASTSDSGFKVTSVEFGKEFAGVGNPERDCITVEMKFPKAMIFDALARAGYSKEQQKLDFDGTSGQKQRFAAYMQAMIANIKVGLEKATEGQYHSISIDEVDHETGRIRFGNYEGLQCGDLSMSARIGSPMLVNHLALQREEVLAQMFQKKINETLPPELALIKMGLSPVATITNHR